MVTKVVSVLLGLLFYRSPVFKFTEDEVNEYERLYSDAVRNKSEIMYASTFPKFRFAQYIAMTKPVIMHGSNHKNIEQFELRKQTLFNGKYVEAIFGTKDGIWPLFYAVFDRSKVVGNFRNACLKVKASQSYYFFSITSETKNKAPWTSGMVYILPQDTFKMVSHSVVSFDEWISESPVLPITKIEVGPQDFYFIDKVASHKAEEPLFISWIFYKRRVKRNVKVLS